MDLSETTVRRGGVTAQYWYGETSDVSCRCDKAGLEFRFSLPSKGGGETDIQVTVGPTDLREILGALASELPDLADALAAATLRAVMCSKLSS